MLCALAELREREGWQGRVEEFEQEKSRRDFDCSGTGQSATRWQVSLDFGRKPVNLKTDVKQLPNDSEDIIYPARLRLRSKIFAPDLKLA